MDWKNNRRVQIAVGVAVVALALRWLFGPSLQDATLAYQTSPEDGNLSSPFSATAVIWPLVEIGLTVLAAIGLYAINIGEWLVGKVQNLNSETSATLGEDPQKIQADLARAVAKDDQEALAKLAVMIRRPYAIAELSQAAKDGDYETAELKLAQLKKMAGDDK